MPTVSKGQEKNGSEAMVATAPVSPNRRKDDEKAAAGRAREQKERIAAIKQMSQDPRIQDHARKMLAVLEPEARFVPTELHALARALTVMLKGGGFVTHGERRPGRPGMSVLRPADLESKKINLPRFRKVRIHIPGQKGEKANLVEGAFLCWTDSEKGRQRGNARILIGSEDGVERVRTGRLVAIFDEEGREIVEGAVSQ